MDREWSDDEDRVLAANWREGTTTTREMEVMLNRTRYSITARANRLGLRRDTTWTAERIEQLQTLWANGSSASEIAAAIGGISRNSVLGKVHRLGLEGRPSPIRGVIGTGRQRGRRFAQRKAGSATTLAAYLKHPPAVDAASPPSVPAVTAPPVRLSAAAAPLLASPYPPGGVQEGGGRPCQFIYGDVPKSPARPHYCGAPTVNESSWCSDHYQRVFIPRAERFVDKGRLARLAAAE